MILDEFFKPNATDNLTERVTFDANGKPIYPNLQNFQGAPAAAPAAATDDAAADTADDDAAEPPVGSTPVAPVGGSAQLQNPAARAEYQRVRSTADKFSFSNPEFRKEYDRIARFRDTASNRIMSGNRSYSPEPGLAARQHQELVKMLYQIDADFVQDANILLKNYGALKEQDMDNDNLQGGRSDDEVKFFIDSEPAYYAVMDRFGDHIDFRGDDMVAPLRLWGAIQQTAGDAGGAADIAGLEDDRMGTDDELDEQDMSDGSYDKLSLFQRVFPNEQLIQQAQDSINQRMMQAGEDNPAIKYLDNAYNILSLMYSNPTEKLASEFYNNIRRARDVEQQGLAENYPKHQDLSGISTDKLKAYVAKYTSHPMSGEGAQVRRVRAELERRSQGMAEAKADPTGSWVVYNGSKVTRFKTHSGAKAYAEKNGGQVASSEYYHDKIQKQGVAEGSDRIAANKQDRLQALENKLKAKGYTRTKDSDGGEYQYRWTRDGAPSYVVNYRSGANGYAEFRKEQGVAEGHGNYAGDRPVNLGGVSMKKIQIGDTVRYIDQTAQVVDMSRDREHARITSPSSATTKTVLTSDLRQLGRGVSEGNDQQLSVQQLATISDEALDNAYGYGRSSPGNTFGWQANLKSAAYAKQMIDRGATDIEAISDAIHQGWNTTAKAFVQNPEQFDDTEKLRAAGKLEAKLQQRAKLMNIDYDQLPDDEQEKDRVVARALLQALKGRQDAEAPSNKQLDELSPATLARYKTKAGAAATAADSAGDRKTGDRRFSGIVEATKKQFDQDAKQSAQAVHESRLRLMASIIKTQ